MPLILTRTPSSMGSANRANQPITPPQPPDPPVVPPDTDGEVNIGFIISCKWPITCNVNIIIEGETQ